MGPLGVVEVDPLADDAIGPEAVGQLVQIDRLVLERSPQPLDEDVVHAATPSVNGDGDTRVFEHAGEVEAGKLAALVGVEDFRRGVSDQRLGLGLDAEPGVHGVRQPPGENMARRPIHNCDQIQKAALDRDVGDVGAPHPVGAVDRQPRE